MKKIILFEAKKLANNTINLHNENKLGKKSMITFLKEQLGKTYDTEDCNKILIEFCSILAKRGYEIMIDTDHFDIIDYNSNEYQKYTSSLIEKRPKNYDKLRNYAEGVADKMISMYHSKTYINKSYQEYINEILSKTKYSDSEKTTIEVNTIHFITIRHYDIVNTSPLVLSEF